PSLAPTDRFLAAVEQLLHDDRALGVLDAVSDPRLTDAEWRVGVKREITLLAAWALRRLAGGGRLRAGGRLRPARVYSFLPRHAIVVHLLRRAVPFAALGLHTRCGGHASIRGDLISAVAAVS